MHDFYNEHNIPEPLPPIIPNVCFMDDPLPLFTINATDIKTYSSVFTYLLTYLLGLNLHATRNAVQIYYNGFDDMQLKNIFPRDHRQMRSGCHRHG